MHHAVRSLSRILISFGFLFSAGVASLAAQNAAAVLQDPAIEQRVDELLGMMTLKEKVGQLVQRAAIGGVTGLGPGGSNWGEVAARGEVGSLFGLNLASDINPIQRAAVEKSHLHIPVLFGLDVIHGFRTTLPVPLGMASTWNPELVERGARVAAEEAYASGVRWTFSPMVDIARDARWGRIVEGAGEDPYLGSAMARAYVRGYQGRRLDVENSIAACAKHFVGYGAAEGGRDYNTTEISERTLHQIYLPPFKAAVDAGVVTIMSAFNSLNGVPASSNHFTLTEILRQEWGFKGFVVSDYGAIAETMNHGIANDPATAARKALLAGVDMDMEDHLYPTLIQQVKDGKVPESAIDESVRRILRVKFALGLFDHPYGKNTPVPKAINPDYLKVARQLAEESLVLLKNDSVGGSPLLPLPAKATTLALIGPLADAADDMLGPWSTAASGPQYVVTLRKALAERMAKSGGKVLYAQGTEVLSESTAGFAEAVAAARQADVTILALGEHAWDSGEAGSKAHLGLPGNQQQLLEAVAATGKPVVVVLFNGHPLAVTKALPKMQALLEAWFPGVQAGPAVANVLFGDVNPSGKLPVTIPRAVGQEPLYYNALSTGRPAEGIDLTHPPRNATERFHSRYIDEQNAPLFPFGFGLSYTPYQYGPLTLETAKLSAVALNAGSAPPLHVSADVKNIGSRAGEEIVQLYIRERGTSVARPVRELKGFQRVQLAPGESKRVEFTLGADELRFWNIDMKDVVEPAEVTVWIAPSSAAGSEGKFEITK
jgi:beta-glucosidase